MTRIPLRIGRTSGFCIVAVLAAACTAASSVQATRVPGDIGAEILWDGYGVPHIFAADRNAAAYAFGWAQMQNHGDLLLRLYAQGRGRAAELLGPAYLNEDRWVWTMGIPQRAEAWVAEQPTDMRAHLAAFVRGINAFAAANPDLIGDSLRAVLPVRESDVMAHGQRWMLSAFVTSRAQAEAQAAPWRGERGSNAWAIAPSRSASGHALLLANPHLPWSDLFTWFEAQIAIPEADIYGAALVGSPVLQIAFNDRLGWSHTVNTQDGEDLYELTLAGDGYEWDGSTRQFDAERHILQVRTAEGTLRPDTLDVRRSVHGPVVAVKEGRALALRTVGLEITGHMVQWWRMGTARSLAEFREAVRPNTISTQNIVYADADGHIMFFYGGNTPVRPVGDRAYWRWVVPGNSSANLWTELHGFVDMPLVIDPPTGWVQNANNPPWWTTFPTTLDRSQYPDYLASTDMSLRAQRSAALVEGATQMTFERLVTDKHSTEMELANRTVPDFTAAGASREEVRQRAAAVLQAWDRRADAGSVGGVLFAEWWREYAGRMRGRNPFALGWSMNAPRETPRGLSDTAVAFAALEAAAQRVVERYGTLEVPWGDVYRLRRDTVDLPANGAPHDFGVFRMVDYRLVSDNRWLAVSGDSYVAAVEFGATVRAMSLIGYGNASRAGSPHRTDQLRLFSEQRLKPVWRSRPEVEQNTVRREQF
jgi:acyl-homoserine-lactone acylase